MTQEGLQKLQIGSHEFSKIVLLDGMQCYEIQTVLGTHFRIVDGYGLSEVGLCFNCHQLFYKEYPERKFCCHECFTRFKKKRAIEKREREKERRRMMLENCLADI